MSEVPRIVRSVELDGKRVEISIYPTDEELRRFLPRFEYLQARDRRTQAERPLRAIRPKAGDDPGIA